MKRILLRAYHISSETYRKIFKTHFNSSNAEAWFRSFKQDFNQWIETSNRDLLETVLHMLALQKKLHPWLQGQMRNLNPSTFEELSEAVARYQGNSRKVEDPASRTDLGSYKVPPQTTPTRNRTPEYKQRKESNPPPHKDNNKQVKCFRCGKLGHMRRDCRVKMERVNG